MKDFVLANRGRIDTDNSGGISVKEIDVALLNTNGWNTRDLAILHKLKEHHETISRVTYNSGRSSSLEVTPFGAIVFDRIHKQLAQERAAIVKAVDFAKVNFSELDTDKNGYVSMMELYASPKAATPEMQTLIRHAGRAKYASNDEWFTERKGVSMNDLYKYQDYWQNTRDYKPDGACTCGRCVGSRPRNNAILKAF